MALMSANHDHHEHSGANLITETFNYKVTDALGNSTTSSIVVNIVDDVPQAQHSERFAPAGEIDTNLLLVEVRPDTNHDQKYTHADGTYWLRFDLRNLAVAPVRQPSAALTKTLHQQMLERQSRL